MLTEGNALATGGMIAAILAMGGIMISISLAVYIYAAIALMFTAKRTKTPNGWFAFIPILNVYLIAKMAGLSGWWTLIVLAPIIPFVGAIAAAVAIIVFASSVSFLLNHLNTKYEREIIKTKIPKIDPRTIAKICVALPAALASAKAFLSSAVPSSSDANVLVPVAGSNKTFVPSISFALFKGKH